MAVRPDYDAAVLVAARPDSGADPGLAGPGQDPLALSDVQGNLLRGYHMAFVRHLIVRVGNAGAARTFIAAVLEGSGDMPRLTTAAEWDQKPLHCLNLGITATGLAGLGLGPKTLATFPEEFRIGSAGRASKVGDVDGSAPELWRDGFDDADKVHLIWNVHAQTEAALDQHCDQLEELWRDTHAFTVTSRLDGERLPDKVTGEPSKDVHFGYRDEVAQPRFRVGNETIGLTDRQPLVPVGALLQIHGETSFSDVKWQVPKLVTAHGENDELSHGSCFSAFRVMEQDVDAFEDYIETEAEKHGWNKEFLAAKLMGRWRNGVPIALTPDDAIWSAPGASMPEFGDVTLVDGESLTEETLNAFDYPDEREGDDAIEGRPCPVGAHIRRGNPRSGRIVQRSANHTRPIVRRGMPYGPPFDPENRGDGERRGLLLSVFCGSLIGQFEAMMYDWINMGLQDPRITGTNCPIIGANNPRNSRFEIPIAPDPDDPGNPTVVTVTGFPRFVETVGAAYFFYPSLQGLQVLAGLKEGESV